MHDLAATIGSSGAICAICSLAAGLAAVSLSQGTARIKKDGLPRSFPGDPEALQSKYALAFSQLEEARKGNPMGLTEIINNMRGQPAPALCLQAFEEFSQSLEETGPQSQATPPEPKLGGSLKAPPKVAGPQIKSEPAGSEAAKKPPASRGKDSQSGPGSKSPPQNRWNK